VSLRAAQPKPSHLSALANAPHWFGPTSTITRQLAPPPAEHSDKALASAAALVWAFQLVPQEQLFWS
jgi:hypothetical protein